MFIGREDELAQLRRIAGLPKASLVVCRGRRRIGKSTLIQHFAKQFPGTYEFQGLAPREQLTNRDQLENFSRQLATQLDLPPFQLRNWHEAFTLLARYTADQEALIFLDEVSWMASRDRDFVGQLKIAWDTMFKKNRGLVLVLCGSVSSWIDRNILNSADFMGRTSLSIDLQELSLTECNEFWGAARDRVSAIEKFRILSVTGGIPRYLEEIDYSASAEQNIADLCFRREGILFGEFDKIFNDIFSRKSDTYRGVVCTLADGPRSFSEVCAALGVSPNGAISEQLADLETSGFVRRDYVYSARTGKRGKLSRYRLKDNYLRFYLKYIEPARDRIASGVHDGRGAADFSRFESILGLQFENLVLNNLPEVLGLLSINPAQVVSASPYFQNRTQRQQARQVDLLIDTRYAVYVCEIKFRRRIARTVVDEISAKADKLRIDRSKSLRRVLIHVGELASAVEESMALDHIVSFDRLLKAPRV